MPRRFGRGPETGQDIHQGDFMNRDIGFKTVLAGGIVAVMLPVAAAAQGVADFYKGKDVQILVGSGVGGGYDTYARLLGRHLGKHIPGQPTVVAQNMPGTGSLKAAAYLYEVAPKDGTALGVVVESAALEQALGKRAEFALVIALKQLRAFGQ